MKAALKLLPNSGYSDGVPRFVLAGVKLLEEIAILSKPRMILYLMFPPKNLASQRDIKPL